MSLNNNQLHGVAFAGTLVLGGAAIVLLVLLTQTAEIPHEPPLKEMMTIEASLARKSEKKTQPQKEQKAPQPPPPPEAKEPDVKAPDPVVKPEGVSRDETKKPADKPKDDKKPTAKPDDKPLDISKYKRQSDDDPQPGGAVTDIGQFDGSKDGFAPINAGDPYWQHIVAEFKQIWELPTIVKVSGATKACFHIEPDGKFVDTKFERSGDETLDDSVQRAMNAIKRARNERPQPVPTSQLGVIKQWVCFRFDPNG
jgi:hypothetical protein